MKTITVPSIKDRGDIAVEKISAIMDSEKKYRLDHYLWKQPEFKPAAACSVLHNGDHIFLKFYVSEKYLRGEETKINGRIWEDSCVEFFISFDNGQSYYNFEYNYIGTGLVGYGNDRTNRIPLAENLIKKIKVYSSLIKEGEGNRWELTMIIPNEIFLYNPVTSLNGKSCKVNFYKCGDLLPEAHFLAWNKVESIEPDFHRTDYFGEILFE